MTENSRDWPIQEIARLSGTTSRTLRHYDDIGLLAPTRVGANGYRYYDADALTRLQRILMLRELGLGLRAIGEVLAGATGDTDALAGHLRWLHQEKQRLDRQIRSIELSIEKKKEGTPLMAEEMFDGFDHTVYQEEVVDRWGADAYVGGDRWWRSLTEAEKARFQQDQKNGAGALRGGIRSRGSGRQRRGARDHTAPLRLDHGWLAGHAPDCGAIRGARRDVCRR